MGKLLQRLFLIHSSLDFLDSLDLLDLSLISYFRTILYPLPILSTKVEKVKGPRDLRRIPMAQVPR